MAREDPHFRLRIPEDLKQRIEAVAQTNRRSMTAEIVERLRDSFAIDDHDDFPGFTPGDSVAAMVEDLKSARKLSDDLYDLTVGQARTINSQAEAIEAQSATIKAQARLINKLTAEQFYDHALEMLGDVPEDDLANQRTILNNAMKKASELFDFEWSPPGQEREDVE